MKYEVTLVLEYPGADKDERIKHETYKDIELSKLKDLIPDQESIIVLGMTAKHIPCPEA
tara:strand:- start:1509 stop:1685 length:177 start_codon:yes stop_codon:yes gene_type:complete